MKALTLISEKKLKINEAARQFGISRATLYRHNRKVIDGEESLEDIVSFVRQKGGLSLLNGLEENVLEKTVFDLIKQGFTVSATDVKKICFEYCNTNGIPNKFNKERRIASDDWYYGFLKRHPILTVSPSSEDEEASSDDTKTDTGRYCWAAALTKLVTETYVACPSILKLRPIRLNNRKVKDTI